MTSAYHQRHEDEIAREGYRVLTFFGILLSNIGSFGILYFWTTGAIQLLFEVGGHLDLLNLDGLPLLLFWSLPIIVIVSLAAWLLYLARLDLPALGLAAAPIGLTVLYYLWLVVGRSV